MDPVGFLSAGGCLAVSQGDRVVLLAKYTSFLGVSHDFKPLLQLVPPGNDADLDLAWTALQIWATGCGFKLDPSFTRRMGQRVHEFMLAHPLPQH